MGLTKKIAIGLGLCGALAACEKTRVSTGGAYFDDPSFECVVVETEVRKNIIRSYFTYQAMRRSPTGELIAVGPERVTREDAKADMRSQCENASSDDDVIVPVTANQPTAGTGIGSPGTTTIGIVGAAAAVVAAALSGSDSSNNTTTSP